MGHVKAPRGKQTVDTTDDGEKAVGKPGERPPAGATRAVDAPRTWPRNSGGRFKSFGRKVKTYLN
jgi:hypothetical protein